MKISTLLQHVSLQLKITMCGPTMTDLGMLQGPALVGPSSWMKLWHAQVPVIAPSLSEAH